MVSNYLLKLCTCIKYKLGIPVLKKNKLKKKLLNSVSFFDCYAKSVINYT